MLLKLSTPKGQFRTTITRGKFFEIIFAPAEKLAPTGKVGALATLG
jgi:hypothetical protein